MNRPLPPARGLFVGMIYPYKASNPMSVNLEVKGTLAKLLATEDLIVEHKSVQTASFNVNTRVLTLPRWDKASNTIADLLVAHEVGHALFTPNEDWREKVSCPHMFVNVTEDARIENLMKRKFAGLPKTFYRGYQELHDEDFFGVSDDDIDSLQVADRVNLHFKVGKFLMVKFTDEEQVVVDQIAAAETFEDALEAAEALYALHEKQKEEQQQQQSEEQQSGGGEGQSESQEEGSEGDEQEESTETKQESSEPGEGEGGEGSEKRQELDEDGEGEQPMSGGGTTVGDLTDTVKTMEALEDKLGDLTQNSSFGEPEYFEVPKMSDEVVVSVDKAHKYLQSSWTRQYNSIVDACDQEQADKWYENNINRHHTKFKKFKREIQPEVNYLVKEFECKKAATAYARATTARTGILDCSKLHTYKYNEDLFKKVTSLPEGKNHGLVFVIDWSGSMYKILEDTVKQLLSIVMFCDKVNIPFKVFAFTNEWREREYDKYEYEVGGVFHIPSTFSMITLLSSGVSRKMLYNQMSNVYTMASMFSSEGGSYVPTKLYLSGTPLNEALMCLHTILPKFKSDANVEKSHVIVLTDGEAGGSCYTVKGTLNGEEFVRPRRLFNYADNVYLRNRKTGITRNLKTGPTKNIIEDLRDTFPNSSFTGFRICERGNTHWVRQACSYDEKLLAAWKKEKCVAIPDNGYSKQYVIAASKLQEDADFDVDEGATKAKIKSAFAKSLNNKKSNKRILSDFIGEIA